MDAVRWEQVQELFHAAAGKPAAERAAFLDTVCGSDKQLQVQVLAMLNEDDRGGTLLDGDLAVLAERLLDGGNGEGRQIGAYRLGPVLGEGGMSVVYLAERDDLHSKAAVKILRDAWMSPARRERFALEQRTLAKLNHSSIARLFDAGTLADGTPWIVMEYVEGIPITEYCRSRELAVAGRLKLFLSVCEAVEYAHRHAIIHRDLKPSNILVKADASVRLLDFGIAKQLDSSEETTDRTKTGLRWMTPAYAAPEQIRGENAGMQTDVYALGVVLYEMLTGRLPFDGPNRSAGELEKLILENDPQRPSSLTAAGITRSQWADLDVLCLTAMHKDPTRRYRSVEALLRDLDHYSKGEPLDARPDTWRYRGAKFVSRNRRSVVAAAAMFVMLAGVIVFFLVRLTSARNIALGEASRTQRIERFMLNLFDGGDKTAGPAEDLRVITVIDRGAALARTLGSEPAVQAELYSTLGGVYQQLGKFDKAETMMEAALDERKSLRDTSAAMIGDSEISLGLLRSDQAKLEEAERLVRSGLARVRKSLPASDPEVLKATTALGQVLEKKGDYKQGIALMEAAVGAPGQTGHVTPELAVALEELGNHYFYAGRYDDADSVNHRVLAMYQAIYGDAHPKVAGILLNLGAAQQERGNYQEAERYHRQSLAIVQKFYGPEHVETAAGLTQVARALVLQNRFDEADALLRHALAIRERVYGPAHPNVASTMNELGSIAYQRSHYDEAAAAFRRMIEIYRQAYHDRHYLIGIAESNLASVYMSQKDYQRAEPLFRDAIARYLDTLSPEHTNVGIARIKLGRLLLREKRYREAEQQAAAGLGILSKQANPAVSWVKTAREDLAQIHQALGEPAKE
jgi:serine/threonine protein kinase/tetratricopeptide (TPR) repeat protein